MKIKLIDFGGTPPQRAHFNDAGADVFASIKEGEELILPPHKVTKVPLGIGIELPDGFVAFVAPRSGLSSKHGLTTELVPIDSGYRGEIHAIVYNASDKHVAIKDGYKIAQLVIVPTILATFQYEEEKQRGTSGFGSTGDTK